MDAYLSLSNRDFTLFQWLVVDRKALLKEQQSFDAKTTIWIPDTKDGYAKADIVSTKGDDVTVKNANTMQVRPRDFR